MTALRTSRASKIVSVSATPLYIPYRAPYYWAKGVVEGIQTILVKIELDSGLTGYGECIGTPAASGLLDYLQIAERMLIGRIAGDRLQAVHEVRQSLFIASGAGSAPRFAGQVLAGIEMALWDIAGKEVGVPAHALLGGRVRDTIAYFGFAQGADAEAIAADAKRLVGDGHKVIYVKLGRGLESDAELVAAVRAAIGPGIRLRVDPNESWSAAQAIIMGHRLLPLDVEMIEQPVNSQSFGALEQVKQASPVCIAADQSVFNAFDAFHLCSRRAADLLVVGLHETGGIWEALKVAHIAEAAGVDVCIHGQFETGITAYAAQQFAAVVRNLDDANQIMTGFLAWDIVRDAPAASGPRSPIPTGPGLGFELDIEAVERSADLFQRRSSPDAI